MWKERLTEDLTDALNSVIPGDGYLDPVDVETILKAVASRCNLEVLIEEKVVDTDELGQYFVEHFADAGFLDTDELEDIRDYLNTEADSPLMPQPRKPVAMVKATGGGVVVVCDDGTQWLRSAGGYNWDKISCIPGTLADLKQQKK